MDEPVEPETYVQSIKPAPGPGERLRLAREDAGLSLAQVAVETRIPQRHLEVIEAGDFGALPARTYAIGFAKTFARAVGLDENEIANAVRTELAKRDAVPATRPATFEPGDPARVPGSNIIWIATAAVLALLVIGYFGYNSMFAPAAELPSLLPEEQPTSKASAAPTPAQPAPAASEPVVFTALEPGVWVRFYDASGTQLLQKELAQGETYTVPANAQGPLLWTGRPDALKITVGGREIPRLADRQQIVKDVPVSAAALLARPSPTQARPQAAAPSPAPTPSATPTPRPTQARRAEPAPTPAARAAALRPAQRQQNPAPGPVEAAIAAAGGDAPTD